MAKYVDLERIIGDLKEELESDSNVYGSHSDKVARDEKYEFAIDFLSDYSGEDVEPVRHGDWVDQKRTYNEYDDVFEDEWTWHCSECGETIWAFDDEKPTDNYCRACGAKMDGGKE